MRRTTAAAFVKKTKRLPGVAAPIAKVAVSKVVREHYLRDDVACGSEACSSCTCEADKPALARNPASTALFAQQHYIMPDADVVIHQIDALEHATFHDVIVLETVLGEVKQRSQAIYERLREIIANPERRFYVFLNEHFNETFVERDKDESLADRTTRAVHSAMGWYREHLEPSGVGVVLLVEDDEQLRKAQEGGYPATTVFAYVQSLENATDLCDMLVRPVDRFLGDKEANYTEHVTKDDVEIGIKTGKYVKGLLNVSTYDHNEAIVWVQGTDTRVIVEGVHNMNRAVHEDEVIIEILPREQWQHPSAKIDVSSDKPSGSIALTINEPILNDQVSQPTGRVVAIHRRHWRPYCGSIAVDVEPTEDDEGRATVLFVPVDRRIPRVWIQTRQLETLRGKRIVAVVDTWSHCSQYPYGHYTRTLGSIGDKSVESEAIMIEHSIPHDEFTHAVLSCLPPQGDAWTVDEHGGHDERRRDLRHLTVCSVDPPGCTDIDDALHVRKLENGNYEVGVHIADVTYFVRPGTAMDLEASQRGTTVYLVEKRIDMLPELLGTNLCSLKSNVDRFAFSCLWEMTPSAEAVSVSFCKSIIKSRRSMAYDDAQTIIDDVNDKSEIAVSIKTLNKLAKKLNQKRRQNGALALASQEVRVALQRDSQDPVDVEMKEMKEANSMVEEFMLLANISVAEKINEIFQQCSLLRRHATPAPSRFDYLIASAKALGIDIDPTSSRTLADSLDHAVLPSKPYLNRLMRILTTRCMTQAQYICSGKFTPDQFHHYGLAAPIYTHFTSPIRRYADVVVHRLLAAAVDADTTFPEMLDKDVIHRVCRNLNRRHKLAQYCGRASVQLYTILYLRGKNIVEEAHIIRVLQNAIVVLVKQYGIEGVITLQDEKDMNGNNNFVFDPAHNRLTSKDLKVSFNLFDTTQVLIRADDSDPLQLRIELKLVEPFVSGVSVNPPAQASSSVSAAATATASPSSHKKGANAQRVAPVADELSRKKVKTARTGNQLV